MCVVFAVGTDLWKKRAAEKEREAGVLLLFEEERGLGEGTEHAWESSSVAL